MTRLVPYTEAELAAALAFNERMRAHRAPTDFLLPESIPAAVRPDSRIQGRHYLVMENEYVRGGLYEVMYPAWRDGSSVNAFNFQSPLSEGIVDRRYVKVSIQLVKYMEGKGPHVFMVGMGDQGNSLPRLLKAAKWSVEPIPFYFRVHHAGRFLRELQMLKRQWWKSLGAHMAAYTGLGRIAISTLQNRGRTRLALDDYSIEETAAWGDWANDAWRQFRMGAAFAVTRDAPTLHEMYPPTDLRLRRFIVRRGPRIVGWSVCYVTAMRSSVHFGDMTVGAILDCVAAEPEHAAPIAALTDRKLASFGADLVVTNQSLALWQNTFRNRGFLEGPSNFQCAASPTFAASFANRPVASGRIHVVRGDGDGRIHL